MSDSPSVRVGKRKQANLTDYLQGKKPRTDDAVAVNDVTPQVNDIPSLQKLLDFTAPNDLPTISNQFDQVANALLHDFHLVVRSGDTETEFQILELEFYLLKAGCHEDPFTHGSEEQKIGGKWYFHRAPRWSSDSHRSLTSLTEYRSGSRKGMDLTIGSPATITSPHLTPSSASTPAAEPLLRGGVLLRSLIRVSDSKVTSGPSLLVDKILLHSNSNGIPNLVEEKWGGDTSAFAPATPTSATASLCLRPIPTRQAAKPAVYRSPRIGLDLSHSGTTGSPTHPRVVFLSKRYRYFTRPELLTEKGRAQTFLGVLQTLRETGRYGSTIMHAGLRHELVRITAIRGPTVKKYLEDYKAGVDHGDLKSFVGSAGKGASSSPSSYLKMMGTLEMLSLDEKAKGLPLK